MDTEVRARLVAVAAEAIGRARFEHHRFDDPPDGVLAEAVIDALPIEQLVDAARRFRAEYQPFHSAFEADSPHSSDGEELAAAIDAALGMLSPGGPRRRYELSPEGQVLWDAVHREDGGGV